MQESKFDVLIEVYGGNLHLNAYDRDLQLGELIFPMTPDNREYITYLINSENIFEEEGDVDFWNDFYLRETDAYLIEGDAPKKLVEFRQKVLHKLQEGATVNP